MNLCTAPSPADNYTVDLEVLPDISSFSKGDLYELCLNRGGPLADSIYNLVSGEVEYNNINSERESNNMLDRARVDIERIAECLRLSLGAINQKIGDAIALSISVEDLEINSVIGLSVSTILFILSSGTWQLPSVRGICTFTSAMTYLAFIAAASVASTARPRLQFPSLSGGAT